MLSYSVTTTVLPSFVGSEMLGSGIGHHKNRHSSYLDKIFFLEVLRTIFFQKKIVEISTTVELSTQAFYRNSPLLRTPKMLNLPLKSVAARNF